jgi:glycosyltransferase involved in cell wall biosynthesis
MKCKKPTILVLTDYYLPGFKGGGPIRTIANMVEALGNEMNFKILALDRDLGCNEQYLGIHLDNWQPVEKAEVYYIAPNKLNWLFIRHIIMNTNYDILYLNSYFSIYFGIIPLFLHRLGFIKRKPTIVAPRGEFSSGAIKIKSFKKMAYINFSKLINIHMNIIWHFSSAFELEDFRKIFKIGLKSSKNFDSVIAPNLPQANLEKNMNKSKKDASNLKIAFLSRISPKKNLDGALQMLTGLKGNVKLNIYGPIEDKGYWNKCLKIIAKLPVNIFVTYRDMVNHDDVHFVFAQHNLFLFPSHGENFGHVIIEALAAGCPVLISDQTPWRNLEKQGVGWDLPLDHPERFTDILQKCINMNFNEFVNYSVRAQRFALEILEDTTILEKNRELFLSAIK